MQPVLLGAGDLELRHSYYAHKCRLVGKSILKHCFVFCVIFS